VQYGPPIVHQTEEARSRFLSPIFNRLVVVFDFALRNLPESILEGRITTKGRVEYYFKAFGSLALVFVEFKREIGSPEDRLNAIAQVIAECDAGDRNNEKQGFRVAVHGILCDGTTFEFFRFDGTTKPSSFHHGRDTTVPRTQMQLPNLMAATPGSFIDALRPICEFIFDLMMMAYISSLLAWYMRSVRKSNAEWKLRPSLFKWNQAIKSAQEAQAIFRDAETKRQMQHIDEADALAQQAMESLQDSLNAVPIIDRSTFIMSGWDDGRVGRV